MVQPSEGRVDPSRQATDCPRLGVVDMLRSLAFYEDLGCRVRLVADGWVQLEFGETVFRLVVPGTTHRTTASLRLVAKDPGTVVDRLARRGHTASYDRRRPGLELRDPDRNPIVLTWTHP